MKIEIKNVKYLDELSHETLCFFATLYIDGKKVGTVANRGCGGGHEYDVSHVVHEEADEWCKKNLPKWSFGDGEHDTDLEMHISHLVQRFLQKRELQVLFRNHVIFKDDECSDNEYYKFRCDRKLKYTVGNMETVYKMYKDRLDASKNPVCLNSLPIEEATDLFMGNPA